MAADETTVETEAGVLEEWSETVAAELEQAELEQDGLGKVDMEQNAPGEADMEKNEPG